ncbi:MAG: YceI family protein [Myxococcota bacterium]
MQTASCQQTRARPRARRRAPTRRSIALALVALAWGLVASGATADRLVLEPRSEAVRFTLGATLHEVEGTLDITSGEVVFPEGGGECSGEIVLDARSARTGNARRDEQMHAVALESGRHRRIVFRPRRLAVEERLESAARVRVEGLLELHGVSRGIEMSVRVALDPATPASSERVPGRPVIVELELPVRYVDWGVADVSNFLLRVDDTVHVSVRALGRWLPEAGLTKTPSPEAPTPPSD